MPDLFTRKFSDSASSQTIDLAEQFLAKRLNSGASEFEMRRYASELEMLFWRGCVDATAKIAPQYLQEDLIPMEQQ